MSELKKENLEYWKRFGKENTNYKLFKSNLIDKISNLSVIKKDVLFFELKELTRIKDFNYKILKYENKQVIEKALEGTLLESIKGSRKTTETSEKKPTIFDHITFNNDEI